MELRAWHMWWKRHGLSELRSVVMEQWDPIGVRDEPEAQDEYDSYLGQLAGALRRGVDEDGIAQMLATFCEVNIGSPLDAERDAAAAGAIVRWYQAAMEAEDTASLR